MRLSRLLRWPGAAILMLCAQVVPVAAEPDGMPNVVLVTVDTLRLDRVGAYGYERPTTPNIDRLLTDGVRFDQARTVEPLTSPALSSMITALYPHQHGSSRNGLRVRTGLPSLPKAMQANGYRTAALVGSWTLRNKLSGLAEHFEQYEEVLTRSRWFGFVRREATADDLTTQALEWIREHRHEPFLLWVHYVEPHAPYRLQREFVTPLGLDDQSSLKDSDRYDTEVAYVDRSIGHLMQGLEELALSDRSLVVFASDHGESLGEHGYWGHGRHLYEPTLRIPMGLHWPGRLTAKVVEAPALILDIAPTVLGLLGLEHPTGFEGFDWTAVLDGEAPPEERVTRYQSHKGAVIAGHDSDRRREAGLLEVCLLRGTRKEVVRLGKQRREVFDLAIDPLELNNLGSVRDPMSEGLTDWIRQLRSGLRDLDIDVPEPLDTESAEALRALGYVD